MAINLAQYNYDTHKYEMLENQYSGCVLKMIHNNSYRIMSDVWGSSDEVLVWDKENNCPKHLVINVYDMGNPPMLSTAEIDATEEVKNLYYHYTVAKHFESLLNTAKMDGQHIERGCRAKVVKGRNGKGTEGLVAVVIQRPYNAGYYNSRMATKIAIATSDVKVKKALTNGKVVDSYRDLVWVWAHNCTRLDIPKIDLVELRKRAEEAAARVVAQRW